MLLDHLSRTIRGPSYRSLRVVPIGLFGFAVETAPDDDKAQTYDPETPPLMLVATSEPNGQCSILIMVEGMPQPNGTLDLSPPPARDALSSVLPDVPSV